MEPQTKDITRSTSRSRRSHTNLSNLRLAPLSTNVSSNDKNSRVLVLVSDDPDMSYQVHHSSYIQDRSAPSTPGILGRSSSRHKLSGGLSRRLSIHTTESGVPTYAAVAINRDGTPLNGLRPDATRLVEIPKAKSDAALLYADRDAAATTATAAHSANLHTHFAPYTSGDRHLLPLRHHRRSHTSGGARSRNDGASEDNWLTRAALTTTSILRESKGQSWLSSHQSSTSLIGAAERDHSTYHSPYTSFSASASDNEDESTQQSRASLASLDRSSHRNNSFFADDELSPDTPRRPHYFHALDTNPTSSKSASSPWGSRFGSRAASARNSRRGSHVDLLHHAESNDDNDGLRTPTFVSAAASPALHRHHIAATADDYFSTPRQTPSAAATKAAGMEPDFVNLQESDVLDNEDDYEEDAEVEVARLTREQRERLTQRSLFGGFVDRLVGWSLFDVDEDTNDDADADVGDGSKTGLHNGRIESSGKKQEYDDGNGQVVKDGVTRKQLQVPGLAGEEEATNTEASGGEDGEGGWQDAAWLLSLASKVIL
ncbi:hypothetical protein AAFC00_002996 [Neodothiora populina]|uniref:Uncharacterized protein n=1 Tax=Neodothiora populina TaxID=2781224 RepID=A0ABR3P8X9_9PEZI